MKAVTSKFAQKCGSIGSSNRFPIQFKIKRAKLETLNPHFQENEVVGRKSLQTSCGFITRAYRSRTGIFGQNFSEYLEIFAGKVCFVR